MNASACIWTIATHFQYAVKNRGRVDERRARKPIVFDLPSAEKVEQKFGRPLVKGQLQQEQGLQDLARLLRFGTNSDV
jgi:hypothetical protein